MKNIFLVFFLFIFSASIVYASDNSIGTFVKGQSFQLNLGCSYNNTYCPTTFDCNLTIKNPNGSLLFNNVLMGESQHPSYNYTIPALNTNGLYQGRQVCCSNIVCSESVFNFKVTPTGNELTTSQSIISTVILGSMVLCGIFLSILGVFILGKQRIWFYGALSLFLGLALMIYTFSLSVAYTRDLAMYDIGQAIHERIFVLVINIVKYTILFSIPIFIWLSYEAWNKRQKELALFDGWDDNKY